MLNRSLTALFILSLASCAKQTAPLEVDVLKIRSTKLANHDAAMVRGDQNYTLYGKLSAKERQLALGQYYTVTRQETTEPATVKFRYLQVQTKSKEMLKTATLKPGQKRTEFAVIGKDYLTQGRVLAWRIELYQGNTLVDSKQSYMWE